MCSNYGCLEVAGASPRTPEVYRFGVSGKGGIHTDVKTEKVMQSLHHLSLVTTISALGSHLCVALSSGMAKSNMIIS